MRKKEKFVKIHKINTQIGTGSVMNTNNCEISVCITSDPNKILILSMRRWSLVYCSCLAAHFSLRYELKFAMKGDVVSDAVQAFAGDFNDKLVGMKWKNTKWIKIFLKKFKIKN